MAVHQSTQMQATALAPNDVNEAGGRLRVAVFEFTTPTGGVGVGDTVQLCKVPKGARIIGGHVDFGAMSSSTGTAQVKIGDGTTANKYLDTTSVDSAGQADFANTAALNMLSVTSSEETITATAAGEAWAAAKTFNGYVLYVLD